VPNARALERLDRARFINVNDDVKLVGKMRLKIMAQSLRLRPVNHANGAFESRLAQRIDPVGSTQIDHKSRQTNFMKEFFVTATKRRSHVLSFRARAPVGCRGHRAAIRAESEEKGVI